MFERIVNAVKPFGLSIVLLSGLTLIGKIPVTDRVILGYVTIFVAASLIVVHVVEQIKTPNKSSKKG